MQKLHALCSVSESNKQNPRDRTLDLPFFFRYKHIPSLKNFPSPAPNDSLLYWFQGNFAASFVLNFCLREFLLSACANHFELRCETKATDAIVLQNLPLLHVSVSNRDLLQGRCKFLAVLEFTSFTLK